MNDDDNTKELSTSLLDSQTTQTSLSFQTQLELSRQDLNTKLKNHEEQVMNDIISIITNKTLIEELVSKAIVRGKSNVFIYTRKLDCDDEDLNRIDFFQLFHDKKIECLQNASIEDILSQNLPIHGKYHFYCEGLYYDYSTDKAKLEFNYEMKGFYPKTTKDGTAFILNRNTRLGQKIGYSIVDSFRISVSWSTKKENEDDIKSSICNIQ